MLEWESKFQSLHMAHEADNNSDQTSAQPHRSSQQTTAGPMKTTESFTEIGKPPKKRFFSKSTDSGVDLSQQSRHSDDTADEKQRLEEWKRKMEEKRKKSMPSHHAGLVRRDKHSSASHELHCQQSSSSLSKDACSSTLGDQQRTSEAWRNKQNVRRGPGSPTHPTALVSREKHSRSLKNGESVENRSQPIHVQSATAKPQAVVFQETAAEKEKVALEAWKQKQAARREKGVPAHHCALRKRDNQSQLGDRQMLQSSSPTSEAEKQKEALEEWKKKLAARRQQGVPAHHASLVAKDKRSYGIATNVVDSHKEVEATTQQSGLSMLLDLHNFVSECETREKGFQEDTSSTSKTQKAIKVFLCQRRILTAAG